MKTAKLKILLLLCGCLLTHAAQGRSWASYVLESSMLTRSTLSGLSRQRCEEALGPMRLDRKDAGRKRCHNLAMDFSKFLDLESVSQENRSSLTVIFRQDLLQLLSDQRFPHFVRQFKSDLQGALFSSTRFSLYESVRRFTRDRDETISWIGVLFQDTTPLQIHLRWAFQQVEDGETQKRIAEFSAVLGEFWRISKLKGQNIGSFEVYPPEVSAEMKAFTNGKVYHFYVPAVLTQKALKNGYTTEAAVYMAYHFNFLYEAFWESKSVWLLWYDPATIQKKESARDTYLGLRGALYAHNPMHASFLPADYMQRLQKDTPATHAELVTILAWYFRWSGSF